MTARLSQNEVALSLLGWPRIEPIRRERALRPAIRRTAQPRVEIELVG